MSGSIKLRLRWVHSGPGERRREENGVATERKEERNAAREKEEGKILREGRREW